jgi:hypothetical protein
VHRGLVLKGWVYHLLLRRLPVRGAVLLPVRGRLRVPHLGRSLPLVLLLLVHSRMAVALLRRVVHAGHGWGARVGWHAAGWSSARAEGLLRKAVVYVLRRAHGRDAVATRRGRWGSGVQVVQCIAVERFRRRGAEWIVAEWVGGSRRRRLAACVRRRGRGARG